MCACVAKFNSTYFKILRIINREKDRVCKVRPKTIESSNQYTVNRTKTKYKTEIRSDFKHF